MKKLSYAALFAFALTVQTACASDQDAQELEDIMEIVPVPVLVEIDEHTAQLEEISTDNESAIPEEWVVERTEFDVEGIDHPLTQKFRETMLTPLRQKWLVTVLERGAEYRPYIRLQLEQREMPSFIEYLPIVESEFTLTARSRSGATGMWQFMANSMAPYLKKSTYIDERYDPWKSTDAALSKLQDNYRRFGDWLLALAAYNCGAGAMERLLAKYPDKDFWYLAENGFLKNQTAQYVPKLLAIADIIENAEYYDVPAVAFALAEISDEVKDFDYVKTTGMLSFNQISKVTGIDKNIIYQLNPALFRNCTPARQVYNLRLPKGSGENAELALKNAGIASDAVIYTVEKGDSLWAISRRYGISVEDLCVVNGIKENGILSIGKKLIVPIFK